MKRRTFLLAFAAGGPAAFLVAKYGRPDGEPTRAEPTLPSTISGVVDLHVDVSPVEFPDYDLHEEINARVLRELDGGKIPYTSDGIAQITAAIRDVIDRGERDGHIMPGTMLSHQQGLGDLTVTVEVAT